MTIKVTVDTHVDSPLNRKSVEVKTIEHIAGSPDRELSVVTVPPQATQDFHLTASTELRLREL